MQTPTTTTKQETIKSRTGKIDFESMRAKDQQKVRGKFIFHEVPGGTVKFPFRKWKGDTVEFYTLRDGEIYTLPLGVAKHLNKECWYPVHSYLQDENGKFAQRIGEKIRRMSFQSLEFIDLEDLNPVGSSIVTVENI